MERKLIKLFIKNSEIKYLITKFDVLAEFVVPGSESRCLQGEPDETRDAEVVAGERLVVKKVVVEEEKDVTGLKKIQYYKSLTKKSYFIFLNSNRTLEDSVFFSRSRQLLSVESILRWSLTP